MDCWRRPRDSGVESSPAVGQRSLTCDPGDRKELEGWVRARTTPQRREERARIILGSAGGLPGRALAREIGVSLPTVQRWLDRYDDEGLAGLEDRPRPGRPRSTITPEVEAEGRAPHARGEAAARNALEHPPDGRVHGAASQLASPILYGVPVGITFPSRMLAGPTPIQSTHPDPTRTLTAVTTVAAVHVSRGDPRRARGGTPKIPPTPGGGVPPPTRPADDAPNVARLRPQSPHRPAPPPSPPPSSTLRSLSRAPQGHPPPRTWTSDLSRLEHTGHGAPHPGRRGARRPASASIGARRKRTGRVTGITKRGAGTGSGGTRRGSGTELARNRAQPGPSRGHASPHTGRQVPRGWPGGVQRPIRRSVNPLRDA